MTDFKTVARVGDIPPGEGRAFEYNGRMVAVFYTEGEYRAIDDFCPHMGASLAPGHIEDQMVLCPWHAWRFELSSGAWVSNPKIKLDTFQVRIVDDEIQVAGPISDGPQPTQPGPGCMGRDAISSDSNDKSGCDSDGNGCGKST